MPDQEPLATGTTTQPEPQPEPSGYTGLDPMRDVSPLPERPLTGGQPAAEASPHSGTDSEEAEDEQQALRARRRKSPHHSSETRRIGAQLRAAAPRFSRARKGASTPRSRTQSADQAGEKEEEETARRQADFTPVEGVDLEELEKSTAQQLVQTPSPTDPTTLIWTRASQGSPRIKETTAQSVESPQRGTESCPEHELVQETPPLGTQSMTLTQPMHQAPSGRIRVSATMQQLADPQHPAVQFKPHTFQGLSASWEVLGPPSAGSGKWEALSQEHGELAAAQSSMRSPSLPGSDGGETNQQVAARSRSVPAPDCPLVE